MKFQDAAGGASQVGHSAGQQNDLPLEASDAEGRSKTCPTSKPSRLWLWIVAAFALQALAWAAWFTIAARHPVQEVPLATPPAR